jgi:hypothetical protein
MRELIYDGERVRPIQDLAPQDLSSGRLIELAALTLAMKEKLSRSEEAETLAKGLVASIGLGLTRLVNQIDVKLGEDGLLVYAGLNLALKLERG